MGTRCFGVYGRLGMSGLQAKEGTMIEEIKDLLLQLKHRRDWNGPGEIDKVIDRLSELTNEIAGIVDEAAERCKEKP